jgi:hypothetical protein
MKSPGIQAYLVVAAIMALVIGGLVFALKWGRSAGSGATGIGSPPAQKVASKGSPVGLAFPTSTNQRADFNVSVSPPPGANPLYSGEPTVDVFPGEVTTLGGSGGGGIAFRGMGGVVVVGDVAYVAAESAVSKVDLRSGVITPVVGSTSQTGCVTGNDRSASRFKGPVGDLVSDGRDLFLADGCGLLKISISTGATVQLEPWAGPLTIGGDGGLYVGSLVHGQSSIMRVDPSSGSAKRYVGFAAGSYVLGVAADPQYLWAAVDEGPSLPAVIDRIQFADGAITRYAAKGFDVVGNGQLISAGLYLYAPSVGNLGVLRLTKKTGAWGLVAGGLAGDLDGPQSSASFGAVRGIASDGTNLWVTDAPNHQLRRIAFSQSLALHLGGG